jgi:hypothetical protein
MRVLVQREMESWRAPLASIAPIPAGPVCTAESNGDRRKAATETATGFKKEIKFAGPIHHRARSTPAVDCITRLRGSA